MGKRLWTEEEIKILEEMYSQYKPVKEISERLKRSKGAINIKAADIGLTKKYIRTNSSQYKAIYQDYNWCYQKYVVEGKESKDIAKEIGVKQRVIEKWVREVHGFSNRNFKSLANINDIQKELITISTLGDGHICRAENYYTFVVSHAENQKDYLYWKYNILKNLCRKEPTYIPSTIKQFEEKGCRVQGCYRLCTRCIDELQTIKSLSYDDKIKDITSFQLAIWLLDDGSCDNGKRWSLCMGLHTNEECVYLLNTLKNKFNIKGKLRPQKIHNKIYNYINFNTENSKIINDFILQNIPNNLDIIKTKLKLQEV